MEPILSMQNVTVYRGDTRVFHNFSLSIPRGCHTAILGPNGAGKSTLLKLLSRELYPVQQAGSFLRLFGQEQWNVWDLRTRLGIVSHDLQQQYLGNTRGLEVILSGYYASLTTATHQQFSPAEQERALQLAQMLGIADLLDRPFASMSTGEQRRFLLGRALVHDPDTLVLDEPTAGLDLKACFQYLELVRRLMQSGKTIILVTHHIHEIPPEVTRVVLLKAGEVVADGEKNRILTSSNLSTLFDTPIALVQLNGFYQALPGSE
ncbi:MAG: ATP-binding cassette domain-containing protein [Candidatus Binatia bacterium]|nr:ATP-binding cassette domain-containing protein [Candidatus Binatia bacterium]